MFPIFLLSEHGIEGEVVEYEIRLSTTYKVRLALIFRQSCRSVEGFAVMVREES